MIDGKLNFCRYVRYLTYRLFYDGCGRPLSPSGTRADDRIDRLMIRYRFQLGKRTREEEAENTVLNHLRMSSNPYSLLYRLSDGPWTPFLNRLPTIAVHRVQWHGILQAWDIPSSSGKPYARYQKHIILAKLHKLLSGSPTTSVNVPCHRYRAM